MGKRKNRSKQTASRKLDSTSSPTPRRRKRIHRQRDCILAIIALLLAVFIGYYWWSTSSFEKDFQLLVEQGRPLLNETRNYQSLGRSHLPPGEYHRYSAQFPTSGPHDLRWVEPGFYEDIQLPTKLVHALEHGNIVIYYDEPAAGVLDQLKVWAEYYNTPWDGIVITPYPDLGQEIVLSAWTRVFRQEQFDPAAAAAFIDAYRGRGPENPVR